LTLLGFPIPNVLPQSLGMSVKWDTTAEWTGF